MSDEISRVAETYLARIERELKCAVEDLPAIEPLRAAIHYAVFPAGKRIRPLFTLLLARDLNGDPELVEPAAVALELLHSASLIHDDLPALDNDEMRRGKPSCHAAFGEATAVLAGDVLVAHALRWSVRGGTIRAEQIASLLGGAFVSLCFGQQLDLSVKYGEAARAEVHRLKTGSLFRVAAELAAITVATPSRHLSDQCADLGVALGGFFQACDDLLDECAETSVEVVGERINVGIRGVETVIEKIEKGRGAATGARHVLDKISQSVRARVDS